MHLSTFLLSPQFSGLRKRNCGESQKLVLNGAVLFAVPLHFISASLERGDVLRTYNGSEPGDVERKCPLGLLAALETKGLKPADFGIPQLLSLEGELDPENEILEPGRDFMRLWWEMFGSVGMEEWVLKGDNHISPPVALMSVDER